MMKKLKRMDEDFMEAVNEKIREEEEKDDGYVCRAVSGIASHTADVVKGITKEYDHEDIVRVLKTVNMMFQEGKALVATEILKTMLMVCGWNDSARLIDKLDTCTEYNADVYNDFIGVFFCDDEISDMLLKDYLEEMEALQNSRLQ